MKNPLKRLKKARRLKSQLRSLERAIREPQPSHPIAKVVVSILTKEGPDDQGKVSTEQYLPPFCETIRKHGYSTEWASSERQLSRVLGCGSPVFLVHLFGEDMGQIASSTVNGLERKCTAVFNAAAVGQLLADKLATHRAFAAAGIPTPRLRNADGFVRARFGSGQKTHFVQTPKADAPADQNSIYTDFVDTRVAHSDRLYYTSVRLLCIDDIVLHAYTRARDACDEGAEVHAQHTPIDPELIEHLHDVLIKPRAEQFSNIARQLYSVLGHGFYEHDLLIDRESGATYVCESGFRFDDPQYWQRFEPVASKIPSQTSLFPVQRFAQRSADAFLKRCQSVINGLQTQ